MKEKTLKKALEIKKRIDSLGQKINSLEGLKKWFYEEHTHTSLEKVTFTFSKKDRSLEPVPGEKGNCIIEFSKEYMNLNCLEIPGGNVDAFVRALEKELEELKD